LEKVDYILHNPVFCKFKPQTTKPVFFHILQLSKPFNLPTSAVLEVVLDDMAEFFSGFRLRDATSTILAVTA
jgi:hypothetical protein